MCLVVTCWMLPLLHPLRICIYICTGQDSPRYLPAPPSLLHSALRPTPSFLYLSTLRARTPTPTSMRSHLIVLHTNMTKEFAIAEKLFYVTLTLLHVSFIFHHQLFLLHPLKTHVKDMIRNRAIVLFANFNICRSNRIHLKCGRLSKHEKKAKTVRFFL